MVDWHNTIQVGEGADAVSASAKQALADLWEAGVEIILCSWCGPKRGREVRERAASLEKGMQALAPGWQWSTVHTFGTWQEKVFKAELAANWGCSALIDDNAEICVAAFAKRLHVYPISTRHEEHAWFAAQANRQPYDNLAQAVQALLFDFRL